MEDNRYFVDSERLSERALEKKHRLEQDPSCRQNHMEYMEGMERMDSDVMERVLREVKAYDYAACTDADVRRALAHETCSVEDLKALLSPAAMGHLEEMAARAKTETGKRSICSRRCIWRTTVKITVFTADSTVITIFPEKN